MIFNKRARTLCYGLNCVLTNACVEVPTLAGTPVPHKVTIFGEKVFKEVIKLKQGLQSGTLLQYD